MKYIKPIILTSFLLSSLTSSVYSETITKNMDVNAIVQSSCSVTAKDINFGETSQIINRTIFINDNFTLRCSKDLITEIGFISKDSETPTSQRRYMLGSNPNNKDKLVFTLGARGQFYTADGSNVTAEYRIYKGTGETTNFNVLPQFRINILGAIINGNLTSITSDLITADNYSTTVTLTLTY